MDVVTEIRHGAISVESRIDSIWFPELPVVVLEVKSSRPVPRGEHEVGWCKLVTVEEIHVGEGGTNRQVGRNEVDDVRGSHEWDTFDSQGSLVEHIVGVENCGLVVDKVVASRGVAIKDLLREEGEPLRLPEIAVVDAHEDDNAQEVARDGVKCSLNWYHHRVSHGCDILPIDGDG